jgi:hypothetical protein
MHFRPRVLEAKIVVGIVAAATRRLKAMPNLTPNLLVAGEPLRSAQGLALRPMIVVTIDIE